MYSFSRAALNLFFFPRNQSAPIHVANNVPFGSFQSSLGGLKARPECVCRRRPTTAGVTSVVAASAAAPAAAAPAAASTVERGIVGWEGMQACVALGRVNRRERGVDSLATARVRSLHFPRLMVAQNHELLPFCIEQREG